MRRRRTSGTPRQSPLTQTEVGARRIAWRRRRARRRFGVVLAALLAVGAVIFVTRLPAGSGRAAPLTHASLGTTPPVATQHRPPASTPTQRDQYRSVNHALAYTSYVRLGAGRHLDVALTFDDGPGPYTSAIIQVLRRWHTPATFFVIGRQVPAYRHLIATEARDGFEIGDHTDSHPFLSVLPESVQRTQIVEDADAVQAAGAPYPRLFRPPYGSFNALTLAVLHAARMLMVLWSVDTSDYARPGVDRIVYVALSGLRPGAIILMHDGGGDRAETLQALPRIILGLRRRGYRAVTVSQLVADDPPPRDQPPPRPLSGAG